VPEVWPTVSALAALVPRLRIGTLVIGNTYRFPALVAKMAAQVDIISGGRFVLGLGAGWQENEHKAYGIPFYTAPERLRRLDEAARIIKSLLSQDRTTFHGRYYEVEDAPLAPKPEQRPLPLLIGGGGEKVTLKIAARHADEWNTWGTPETLQRKIEILHQHCITEGRNPAHIKHSAQAVFYLDADSEVVARAKQAPRFPIIDGDAKTLRGVVDRYRAAGIDELVVPSLGFGRGEQLRDTMDRFIREVAAPFR
jgi:alkanesulfonate monooxygenase SsuD/methylene tetrahydromethanopterin reductase-like flavin-dependent oxidoreductase (luciferase family)